MHMMSITRRVAIAAISGFALVACGAADSQDRAQSTSGPAEGLQPGDRALGSADAPVTLIEYASITCPHCATFHQTVLPSIKEDYVETGKVRFVFRDFPTAPANIAIAGFALARCQGDDASYFAILDDLFENQAGILSAARAGAAKGALQAVGQRHGLETEEAFDACLQDNDVRREIADVVGYGDANGVTSTPTLFINDRRIERNEEWFTPEGLSAIIDRELGVEPAPAETEAPAEAEDSTAD